MLLHPLSYLVIQRRYQNKSRFAGVYSKNSLPKVKDGLYVKHLDKCNKFDTHLVAVFVQSDATHAKGTVAIYFEILINLVLKKEIFKVFHTHIFQNRLKNS